MFKSCFFCDIRTGKDLVIRGLVLRRDPRVLLTEIKIERRETEGAMDTKTETEIETKNLMPEMKDFKTQARTKAKAKTGGETRAKIEIERGTETEIERGRKNRRSLCLLEAAKTTKTNTPRETEIGIEIERRIRGETRTERESQSPPKLPPLHPPPPALPVLLLLR